ncbi:MAG: CoA-binding protein [Candidatus Freyarchaeota archaeon]|nr:CoA-binding protein [Candidatus Jordarchaeia archaeon]MBS7267881.1 CoA-binding protein [Candidatus Jordarchaeia archaeon]MBS7279044.1 CoA-binding protein [Candidatus Jordarchaeia archaeon]
MIQNDKEEKFVSSKGFNESGSRSIEFRGDLAPFFEPKSIAIIGAVKSLWFGGLVTFSNLKNLGYKGQVYLVNPSYPEIEGIKVYPNIKEVPDEVDLAVIITSARAVPGIVRDCVEKGVKGAVIVADGFAERDEEGAKLQQEIVNISKHTGIRILGPNTIGVVNPYSGVITTPYPLGYKSIRKGHVALAAQTGIIGAQAFPFEELQYGVSKICDFSNKCDVNETDLLEYLEDDPETKVIALHIEDIRDGTRFLKVAKRVVKKKPILIYKPGRTSESKKALASHTGSIAGDQRIYESAFKQAGLIQVNSFSELLQIAKAFGYQPLPKGNRLGIVTITGGAGIMAIDTAVEWGLVLGKLSDESNEKLFGIHATMVGNPSDIGPAVPTLQDPITPYKKAIEVFYKDPNVDCLLITFYAFPGVTPELYVNMLKEVRGSVEKPAAIWIYGPSNESINKIYKALEAADYPAYLDIDMAVKALGAMYQYTQIKSKLGT